MTVTRRQAVNTELVTSLIDDAAESSGHGVRLHLVRYNRHVKYQWTIVEMGAQSSASPGSDEIASSGLTRTQSAEQWQQTRLTTKVYIHIIYYIHHNIVWWFVDTAIRHYTLQHSAFTS